MASVWVSIEAVFEVDDLEKYDGDAWEGVSDNVLIKTVDEHWKLDSASIIEVDTDY